MREQRGAVLAAVVDVAAVVLFAALGRRSHDEGAGVGAVLSTAAPFLVALGVGWLVVLAARLAPTSTMAGVVLWVVTVAGGLLLRATAWDRGIAATFVVVASLALGILLVGWRSAFTFAGRPSAVPSGAPSTAAARQTEEL